MTSKIPFIPGASTPSEIMQALEYGCDTLKFFPANLFGGIKALKTYGNVFPQVKFCPTGGVNESTFEEYLDLDNVISVGGSWMTK
jgi:2-dehydro-3-deoxyphosphogluconate aldolase/(4S)-4-hydroxy-2-oxoglutarate aldolase